MQYYQEKETVDFLCVDMSTLSYYQQTQGKSMVEGRATAIANLPSSVCTISIHLDYLKKDCKRVKKSQVSKEYLEMF